MFKFIHAADIHLDSPLLKLGFYDGAPADAIRGATRRAFENLVKTAIEEEVAFVLIAGDVFDGEWKDYNTGLYFIACMGRLRAAGIHVYIVAGNHDAASSITKSLRMPDNVRIFSTHRPETARLSGVDVAIHGQSFGAAAIKTDLARSYPAALSGCFNIGLLHTCLNGREGHAPYAPCKLEALCEKGYDYWALGHVHHHEILCDSPLVVFSGNTQGRHARETGPKGMVLVSVDSAGRPSADFRPMDVVRWEVATIDASQCGSGNAVVDQFCRTVADILGRNLGPLAVLRVVIEGQTAAHDEIMSDTEHWTNEIRAAALDEAGDRVWVEKVKIQTQAPPVRGKKPEGAIAELLALVDELTADPLALSGLASELADLEKKLPREFKETCEGWRPGDPGWLVELLSQAKPMLMRHLLRGRKDQ